MSTSAAPITRQRVLTLYHSYLRSAQSFQSYNFREYFVRRTRHRFREELPRLLASSSGNDERLQSWWAEAERDLAQIKRAALVNRMYQAPKLVVEGLGRIQTAGGGGAGAEAAPGGAGQPLDPEEPPTQAS